MAKQVNININYQPYLWQREVHNNLNNYAKGYYHVIKSKRQCGKSIMLEMILLKVALEIKNSESFSVSPTIPQCQKMYNELKDIVLPTKAYKKHNDVALTIEFVNGSKITFKSAAQKESLRGFTCTGVLVIDEAAYISDSVFASVLAWTNVHQPPVIICSTPNFKQGFFYDYYMKGRLDNNIICYDWNKYDTSELLPTERLEMYRQTLSKYIFKTDYLGEFLDLEGSVFGNFEQCINDNTTPNLNCNMGIDWGSGNGKDYTAITIMNTNNEMVDCVYFNDKDTTETISTIIDLIKKYQPLKVNVEFNSIGSVFYDLLSKTIQANGITTQLTKHVTTNESKQKLVNNLQVHITNHTISLLNNNELITELSMYEMKPSPTGKPTYNATNGYHDDLIIATMLALDCNNITKPSFYFI